MYYFDIFVPLLYRILEGAAGGFRECIAYRYGADIEYPVCLVGAIFRNHEAEESGSIGGRARVVVREISKEFLRVLSQIDHIDELFPSFEDGVRIIVGKETRNTMGVAEPTMLVKGIVRGESPVPTCSIVLGAL